MYTIQGQQNIPLQRYGPGPIYHIICFENLDHSLSDIQSGRSQEVTDEITFKFPMKVQLIRIVRSNHQAHQKFKKIESITQSDKIRQFEIFAKNETVLSSRYKLVFTGDLVADQNDILIPIEQMLITSRLVLRGLYKKLTIVVYGQECESSFKSYDIPLAELDKNVKARSRKAILPSELEDELMTTTNIYSQLTEIPKEIYERIFQQSNFHLNVDNIQPALLNEQNVGQDSLQQMHALVKELKAVDDNYIYVDKNSVALYHEKLEQLGKILQKHLKKSIAELHQPAHFNEVGRIYQLLHENLVEAVVFALKNQLSSAKRSLTIINSLLSSKKHALEFLNFHGLQTLLGYLQDQEKSEVHAPFQLAVLETIYNCCNHKEFCERMLQEPEDSEKVENQENGDSTPSKKKKQKKHKNKEHEKSNKKEKEKEKKKKKKRSRSRSNPKDKKDTKDQTQKQEVQFEENIRLDKLSGLQIIASCQSQTESEKISTACLLIMNKLQIYKTCTKLRKVIHKLENPDKRKSAEQRVIKYLNYIHVHLPAHLEMENMLLNYSFQEVITKEAVLERMRELAYSIFDNEKTKISNAQYVSELIQLDQKVVTQGLLGYLSEVNLMSMIGIIMSYSISFKETFKKPLRMFNLCMQFLEYIIQLKGGAVLLLNDLACTKLIVHNLEYINSHFEYDPELAKRTQRFLNLVKSTASLITLLDHIYIKLLGYDFDSELIALMNEVHRYSEFSDESSQKGQALLLLLKNDFFTDAIFFIYNLKDSIDLKEREVEVTLISQILYNVLRQDDSTNSIIIADRMVTQNRRIVELINKEKSVYSGALKLSQYMLLSLSEPYELFLTKDTTKALRETFHNKLRFSTINQDADKNKLIEYFAHYDDQRRIHESLKEEFKQVGVFNKPAQNIQFIDGAIKIFKLLSKINVNFFVPYFENEVIAGVEFFAKKLVTLYSAFLSKNQQVEYMCLKINNMGQILRDYFDVSYRTVELILERLQYRVELGSETQFHSTDLCRILIEYYICISKVIQNPEEFSSYGVFSTQSQSSYSCPEKALSFQKIVVKCLNIIIKLNCYDNSDKIEELQKQHLGHVQSNQELQSLFQQLYIRTFRNIEDQCIVLELISQLLEAHFDKGLVRKNLSMVLFRPMKKNDDEFENYTKQGDLGFMLDYMSELTCFQNLMHTALFSYSVLMRQTFLRLLGALLKSFDHEIVVQIFKIYESVLKGQHSRMRTLVQKSEQELYLRKRFDWVQRMLLVIQSVDFSIQYPGFLYMFNYEHLTDEVVRFFKQTQDEFDFAMNATNEDQKYILLILNLQIQFLSLFSKIMDHENGFSYQIDKDSKSTQYLIEDIPHITHQQFLLGQLQPILSKQVNLEAFKRSEESFEYKLNTMYLELQVRAIKILSNSSKNIVGQIIVLYSDYSETVFKAKPIVTLTKLTETFLQLVLLIQDTNAYEEYKSHPLFEIFIAEFIYMLPRLSFQPIIKVIHNGEVRRKAITQLLLDKKQITPNMLIHQNKIESYQDILNWINSKGKSVLTQTQMILVEFLRSKYSVASSSSQNDERDTNISLPNEPRRHERIFEIYDTLKRRGRAPAPKQFLSPLSKFFNDNILEIEGQRSNIKYSSLSLNLVTPWNKAFLPDIEDEQQQQQIQQNPDLPGSFLFENDILDFIELQLSYPKQIVNELIALVDRQPILYRERQPMVSKPIITKITEQIPPTQRPPEVAQFPPPPPPLTQPLSNPGPAMPIIQPPPPIQMQPPPQMPVLQPPPQSQMQFLEDIRPQQRQDTQIQSQDPRLRRYPMQQQMQMQPQMQQQMQPQMQQQMSNQMMQNQMQQQMQTQIPPPPNFPQQYVQQPMMMNIPPPPIQQPYYPQQIQRVHQQPPPPQDGKTSIKKNFKELQKQEIAEIIKNLTEEEKGILKSYLQSQDPRRERQLREYQRRYPGINRFLQTLNKHPPQ